MTILIHPLTHADAPTAARLVAALIAELSPGYEVDLPALTRTASALLAQDTVLGLLATEDSEPVGLLMLNECAAIYAGGHFGEITELYIAPHLRSQGLAARLLDQAAQISRDRGWKRLEVGAPDQPAWARTKAFYERAGFTEVGRRLKRVF